MRILFVFLALLLASSASAQWTLAKEGEEPEQRNALLPYILYTDSTDLLAGAFYGTTIPDQPWTSAFLMGYASTNLTVPLYGGALNVQVYPRLFVDPRFHLGRWENASAYDFLQPFPDPRPGTHESSEDLFIDDSSLEWWVEIPFHYVLPIGAGRDRAVQAFELRDGLLVSEPSGARGWTPWESGVTQIRLEFFARQKYFPDFSASQSFKTLGFELGLDWDNRDFPVNPSRGSRVQLSLSHDPGWYSSKGDWTVWEVELSKYFDLGESGWFRQQVIALDFWTASTPSWESERLPSRRAPGGVRAVNHRPPHFRGANLGGFWRMRAFPTDRFSDQSSVYYSAEYRMTLRWNPIPKINFFVEADVDWLQIVPFVEIGKVAPAWSLRELHSDMDWDVGIDLRAMVEMAVVRIGVAVGGEGAGLRAMVSHPF